MQARTEIDKDLCGHVVSRWCESMKRTLEVVHRDERRGDLIIRDALGVMDHGDRLGGVLRCEQEAPDRCVVIFVRHVGALVGRALKELRKICASSPSPQPCDSNHGGTASSAI